MNVIWMPRHGEGRLTTCPASRIFVYVHYVSSREACMAESDLSNIREAWRDASDAVVLDGMRAKADYPRTVQRIIEEEMDRRQLDAATELVCPRTVNGMALQVLRKLKTLVRSRPNAATILLVSLLSLWGLGLKHYPLTHMPVAISVTSHIGVYLLAITGVCWPLRDYRAIIRVNLLGCLTAYAWGALRLLTVGTGMSSVQAWKAALFALAGACLFGILSTCLFAIVVFTRNRFSPVFPSGHCAVCGYNLFGLPGPRCPECGTLSVPAGEEKGSEEEKASG